VENYAGNLTKGTIIIITKVVVSKAQALGGIPFAFWHPNIFSQYYFRYSKYFTKRFFFASHTH
jgi:hypothetical protein